MINTYSDFALQVRSSKVVLCHIEPVQRLSVFTLDSGSIYKKSVNYFVVGVSENDTDLTQASSASLSSGEWFYNAVTGELFVNTTDDSNPKTKQIIVKYRLFYSNRPIDLPYDLVSANTEVHYEGRLQGEPSIKQELDDEQIGVVLETATNVTLENTDGHFDEFIDVLFFENKDIKIYSWNENLPLSEAKKIFDGVIQDKFPSDRSLRFSCKDFTFKLRKFVTSSVFTSSDGNVPERYIGTPKRRLFGKLKQVQCVPTDAILDGFSLTGTIAATVSGTTVTGSGTSFLDELSPNDVLIYTTNSTLRKSTVKSVESDTSLTLTSEVEISFAGLSVTVEPKIPWRKRNRNWHIAGHKLRAPSVTVTASSQPNRFTVSSIGDFLVGDSISVDGETAFIRRISGSQITLEQNLQNGRPNIGDIVTKNPVDRAYVNGSEVFVTRDYTLTNGANDALIVLDNLLEFNIAPIFPVNTDMVFTNGSREITVTGIDLRNEFKPRDWIRSDDVTHTTWYEILDVTYDNDTTVTTVTTRVAYAGSTITTNPEKKNIVPLDDDGIVTVDCIGQERSGVWLKTASDVVKDLLENDIGFTNINTSSFTQAKDDAPFIVSYAVPKEIGGGTLKVNTVISEINQSVFGSLVLDDNFDLKYQILTAETPDTLTEIGDDDIVGDVRYKTRNEIVRRVIVNYNHFSDRFNGDYSSELYSFTNSFVDSLIGAKNELELDIYLSGEDDAKTIAQRYAFYNSISNNIVEFKAKLNFMLSSLNDKFILNFDRLYKRFGNRDRRKIGIIKAITKSGSNTTVVFEDLGNSFNRSGRVSDNSAADFTSAPDSEKIIHSYVVDDDVLSPDASSDDEIYTNLIG